MSEDLIDLPDLIPKLGKLFEVDFRRRWTEERPHAGLEAIIASGKDRYIETLKSFVADADTLSRIPLKAAAGSLEPVWDNIFFSGFDSISLYGYLKKYRPKTYLEIGSGNSTLFARRTIQDHALPTQIISVDPEPRVGIDSQCDDVMRKRLQDLNWRALFSLVFPGDIVFFDGSHRAFQDSDVTVFFTEVLPMLPAGVLIGIHDIYLPADYAPTMLGRFYSEQYLLACWLLADNGARLSVELPVHWLGTAKAAAPCREALAPLYAKLPPGTPQGGGAFWIQKK